jgi:cysteinyl-tRNA synthetase
MKLYNSATRRIEDFVPLVAGKVSMYCCGPTVYNYAHIGNFRAYLFEDVLRRTLAQLLLDNGFDDIVHAAPRSHGARENRDMRVEARKC